MRKYKGIVSTAIAITVLSALLTGCADNTTDKKETMENTTNSSVEKKTEDDSDSNHTSFTVTSKIDAKDEDVDWQNETPNYITLEESGIKAQGRGVMVDNNVITITDAGTYVFEGSLEKGQIQVDAAEKKVRVVLNGVTLTGDGGPAIYIKDAKKVILTLAKDSKNMLKDGETYVYDNEDKEEPNACIFSKDDMVINGSGTLSITSVSQNGIAGKDDVLIVNTNLQIKAYNHGIKGKDSVCIKGSTLSIDAGGDGIKSTNSTEQRRGFVCIESGTFNITSGQDGIQAETCMLIEDGTFNLVTGGGSVNASTKESWGNWGPGQKGKGLKSGTQQEETENVSAKGIKSGMDLTVNAGTFKLDTSDDSIHTNADVVINGGEFSIASGDDGMHADSNLTVNGGKIIITKSYEGLEGSHLTFNKCEIKITASDDGINAAGGNDGSALAAGGRPGAGRFDESGDYDININGAKILVNSQGDGIDSNGDINITSGDIVVYGPTNGGNGALDYSGNCKIDGGTLVAAGAVGMDESISTTSKQYGFNYNLSTQAAGKSKFTVKDAKGNMIFEITPEKAYQSVVLSTPELKEGETYTMYVDDKEDGTLTLTGVSTTNSSGNKRPGGMHKR